MPNTLQFFLCGVGVGFVLSLFVALALELRRVRRAARKGRGE